MEKCEWGAGWGCEKLVRTASAGGTKELGHALVS